MSREYDSLIDSLKERIFRGEDSTEVAREKLEGVHGHAIADDVEVEWTEYGGVRCAWVTAPEARDATRVLVLHHGGGYIAAGGDGYLFYADMLSRACNARLLLVDYRLAPEHQYPAALDDCCAAYSGLLESGASPDRIAFIGDSCGGALAVTSLVRLRDQGVALPALAVTLGGWFDLEASGDSAQNPVGHDPFAEASFLRARGRDYVGEAGNLRDPLVSAIYADLRGLPPLLLQVGQVDLTRDDALRLAGNAGKQGVDVTLEVYPAMVHGFQGLANAGIPEAQQALARVASFLDQRIG